MIETAVTHEETTVGANDTAQARRAMIDSQLRTSGVNEEFVLARMMALPREDFLPAEKAALAYIDRSVAFSNEAGAGVLASPLFYGKAMLEASPSPQDNVLVVEAGTSYLTELIKPLVASVGAASVAEAASGNLSGSYSLILLDGAIEQLPESVAACLAEEGRIVSGLVLRGVTRLASGRKIAGQVSLQPVEDIGIPVLHAFDAPKKWTFS